MTNNENNKLTYYVLKSIIVFIISYSLILSSKYISEFINIYAFIGPIIFILNIYFFYFYAKATFNKNLVDKIKVKYILSKFIIVCLIIPLYFAVIYHAFYDLDRNNFFVSTGEELKLLDFIYFSVTTFTTVGFGDITARSTTLRLIVSQEIIVGVIILIFSISNLDYIKKIYNKSTRTQINKE